MDTRQKKTTRDLSDLKSRLGLAKPAAQPAAPAAAQQPGAPGKGTGQHQQVQPAQQAMQPMQPAAPVPSAAAILQQRMAAPAMVVPPPGVMPPPGMPGYAQPQAAPPPDPRRDPFAGSGAQQAVAGGRAVIVDAGPPIEIPKEKKSHTKLVVAMAITAAIPLLVGYAGGRIWAARRMFNQTIDDAKNIEESVKKLSVANQKVAQVIQAAQQKGGGQVKYDEALVEGLKDVLRTSPTANPDRAKKTQDEIFRTNYAMMEGIVIDRLFNYFNNSLRLYQELESFIQKTERSAELIKVFKPDAERNQQNYGLVLSEDKGTYYLGALVQVGAIVCEKPEAKECPGAKNKVRGFNVKVSGGSWSMRPGKPDKKGDLSEIVIPFPPDDPEWKKVAVGTKGYMEHREYAGGLGRLMAICGLLARDEKPLLQDLSKAGNRAKVFAPACSYAPAEGM